MSDETQYWFDNAEVYVTSVTSFELYYGTFYSRDVRKSIEEIKKGLNSIIIFSCKSV